MDTSEPEKYKKINSCLNWGKHKNKKRQIERKISGQATVNPNDPSKVGLDLKWGARKWVSHNLSNPPKQNKGHPYEK